MHHTAFERLEDTKTTKYLLRTFRYATEVAITARPFALTAVISSMTVVIMAFLVFFSVSTYYVTEYLIFSYEFFDSSIKF